MFSQWQVEKATAALVAEAETLADKLSTAKPHIRDSHAAAVRFWELSFLSKGQDLHDLANWSPPTLARFITATQTTIATLRKQRAYDSSDGLAVWLHTARAVQEPRIAPAVQAIWTHLLNAGPNTDTLTLDLMAEAGLQGDPARRAPRGFASADNL